jgi:hypothetical protein
VIAQRSLADIYLSIQREIPLQGNTRRPAMKIVEGKGPGSLRLYSHKDLSTAIIIERSKMEKMKKKDA